MSTNPASASSTSQDSMFHFHRSGNQPVCGGAGGEVGVRGGEERAGHGGHAD